MNHSEQHQFSEAALPTVPFQAHGPQQLLQRFSSQTCDFNAVVINFMTRFQGTQMGYTFFGFATVTKGSILIVSIYRWESEVSRLPAVRLHFLSVRSNILQAFNLMTSYLLVGVQLKQQTCAAHKLQNLTSNASTAW